MKILLKILAIIIDVLLMPVRSVMALEVYITGAILSDISIKDMITIWLGEIRRYPYMLKTTLSIVFNKNEEG